MLLFYFKDCGFTYRALPVTAAKPSLFLLIESPSLCWHAVKALADHYGSAKVGFVLGLCPWS